MSNGTLMTQDLSSGTNSAEASDNDSDEEEFVYPGTAQTQTAQTEIFTVPPPVQHHPSPAQLESLYAAASSGDLVLLRKLFRNALQTGDVEEFALANDASSRTGFTALHAAASRGFLDIVKWCEFPFLCSETLIFPIREAQWLRTVVLCLIWRTRRER